MIFSEIESQALTGQPECRSVAYSVVSLCQIKGGVNKGKAEKGQMLCIMGREHAKMNVDGCLERKVF